MHGKLIDTVQLRQFMELRFASWLRVSEVQFLGVHFWLQPLERAKQALSRSEKEHKTNNRDRPSCFGSDHGYLFQSELSDR